MVHAVVDRLKETDEKGLVKAIINHLKSKRAKGVENPSQSQQLTDMEEVVMTQMNLKTGLKRFSERAEQATSKELQQ